VPPTCGAWARTKSMPPWTTGAPGILSPGETPCTTARDRFAEVHLAVEDVDGGIDILAVHEKAHADLFHARQHRLDLAVIDEAGGRIGGGIGRIELHAREDALAEAALHVVGIGIVAEMGGHGSKVAPWGKAAFARS